MKTLFISIFLLFSIPIFSQVVDKNCMYDGIELYGEVEVVSSFADFDVYISSANWSDCYEVEIVSFATDCHEWEIVNSFPDFTIHIVSSPIFADFSIYFVSEKDKDEFIEKYVDNQ